MHTLAPSQATHSRRIARFYRPELDVLRFFAFLCVFVHHAVGYRSALHGTDRWWIAVIGGTGGLGMCLFFFLSAYLITELLRREFLGSGTVNLKAFYYRRILRIWPLYFGALFFFGLLGLFYPAGRLEVGRFLSYVFLSGNLYTASHGWTRNPVGPLWSISLEEQFYLFWPLLLRSGATGVVVAVCSLLIPISMGAVYHLAQTSNLEPAIWVNSLVQFQFFALGSLAAIFLHGKEIKIPAWTRILMAMSAALCGMLAAGRFYLRNPEFATPLELVVGYELAAVATAMLFLSVLGIKTRAFFRPLIFLGKISFGLYVFHLLALSIAKKSLESLASRMSMEVSGAVLEIAVSVIGFGLAVLIASISYKYFEKPFLKLKEKHAEVASRPA